MWSTDRYRKNTGDAPPRDKPLVIATKIGPRRVIVAADKAAQAVGLRAGLTVAHAQALVPELHVGEVDPGGGRRRAHPACYMVHALQPAGGGRPPELPSRSATAKSFPASSRGSVAISA